MPKAQTLSKPHEEELITEEPPRADIIETPAEPPVVEAPAEVAPEEIVEEQPDIPCPDDPGAVAAHAAYTDAFTAAAVKQATIESKAHLAKQKAAGKEQGMADHAVEAGRVAEEESRIERERLGLERGEAVT